MGDEKETPMLLDLSKQLVKELEELHTRLDGSFGKAPESGKIDEGKPSPSYSNVLDEVIDNLVCSVRQLQNLHDRIVREVVIKIHAI